MGQPLYIKRRKIFGVNFANLKLNRGGNMSLFEKIDKIKTSKKIIFLIFIYSVTIFFIYITGGTKYAFTHTIYIPFLLSSVLFRMVGGIVGGIISAVSLAIMPVNTYTFEEQSFLNWVTRLIIFLIFGYISGFISKQSYKEYTKIKKSIYYNEVLEIPNENAFKLAIDKYIENRELFSVVIIYIENKFEIDNTIGHSKSDFTLKTIIKLFKKYQTDERVKFYYSNNNYKFLLKGFSNECTYKWLKKISYNIIEFPINIEDFVIFLKVKIGAVIYNHNLKDSDQVIRKAFIAMDYSKNNDKDFYIYNDSIKRQFDFTTLISEFKQGINSESLYLEYQPKLNLLDNRVHSVEALIRWSHNKYGMIPPSNFIPQLEKTYYINDLTFWILNTVLNDIEEFNNLGLHLKVSINLTPRNIQDEIFVEKLIVLIKEKEPYSQQIEFEMTETDLMTNIDSHIILKKFREKGIVFAIDDFGTGYSSLAYLKKIPADYIKIDRIFIKELLSDSHDKEIVNSTIKLAHTFGKKIIAEGVENFETLEFLKKIECDEIQGYFFAKPMKKNDLIEFLQQEYKF